MNLLLDTNVVIDFLGKKPPFFEDAERVIAAGYFGDARLWASTQSFKDAFFVLSHYADPLRVQEAILKLMEVVNPVDLTGSDVTAAANLKWTDMEDCLIAVGAQKAGADYLVTRDSKGFDRSMVPPIAPTAWLDLIRKHENITFAGIEWKEADEL